LIDQTSLLRRTSPRLPLSLCASLPLLLLFHLSPSLMRQSSNAGERMYLQSNHLPNNDSNNPPSRDDRWTVHNPRFFVLTSSGLVVSFDAIMQPAGIGWLAKV
jgi:hypothetical protein